MLQFNAPPDSTFARSFLAGLASLGYAEPASIRLDRGYANGRNDMVQPMIDAALRANPRVIVTIGHDLAIETRKRSRSIAIVSAGSEDPVANGLAASLARPGGNVTGVTFMSPELADKRLELLRDALPGLRQVAVVWDPGHFDTYYQHIEKAAAHLGVTPVSFEARSLTDLEAVMRRLDDFARQGGVRATFVVPSRLTLFHGRTIITAALRHRLPTMSAYGVFADAGGLLSYGAKIDDLMRRAAAQTDKLLKGANPGDLPFERASRFELAVNLKTAAAIGVTIPPIILLRADRVIE